MVMCLYYSMLPVKNTFMYLAIMCQPVDDGSYKASQAIIQQHNIRHIRAVNVRCVGVWGGGGGGEYHHVDHADSATIWLQ